MVPICDLPKYFMHKMDAGEKNKIVTLSNRVNKHHKKPESKYVFRKILNAALDENEWVNFDLFIKFVSPIIVI